MAIKKNQDTYTSPHARKLTRGGLATVTLAAQS